MTFKILIIDSDILMKDVYKQWMRELLDASSGIIVQFSRDETETEFLLRNNNYTLTLIDFIMANRRLAAIIKGNMSAIGKLIVVSVAPKLNESLCDLSDQIMTKPLDKKMFMDSVSNILTGGNYVDSSASGHRKSIKVI
jgi:hypothetical protein